jgi:gliding motility-associated-like protein
VRGPVVFRKFFHLRPVLILLTAFFSSGIQAQLCNGSLGDPVVNITFGDGSGGASSYVPTGSYTYIPSTCPNDGYYTITKSTSNCFNGTWFNISNDHTGGGAFMLVNASYTPGDFFLTTVTDLCPNTTYEFAAWIINVMNNPNSILPELTFSVESPDGTVLNSFNTGDIHVTSAPEWKQYGFYFTTPANNPVIVLRITNHAPGGNGNDLGLDDITFRPCGPKITANIMGSGSDTVDVCEGDNNSYTYSFNAPVPAGYLSPLYQWQSSTDKGATWNDIPGATTLTYQTPSIHAVGNYWYRLTVIESSVANISSCKIASNTLMINVHPKPPVDAGPDRIMLINNPVTLSGSAAGDQVTYSWTPDEYISDTAIFDPVVSPPSDITYTLTARSTWGCTNADNVHVKVVTGIFIPTAFTPNGDGKNDRWEIPFLDPSFGGTVNVFDRWGQLVYHVSSEKVSWDGTMNGVPQASGVYVYWITLKNYGLELKGTFTLIR